jgi:YesN/AraC family two-component response regulator
MKHILDSAFAYTPADKTDIRKTFERIRQQIDEQKRREAEKRLDQVIRFRKGQATKA